MDYVEAEGNSIDEAIDRALQLLGVTRDKVDIDIISNSTRGLFGLGGRRARVRATLRTPLQLDSESPAAARPARPLAPPAPAAPPVREPAGVRHRAAAPESAVVRPRQAAPEPPAAPVDQAVLTHAEAVLQDVVRLMGTAAQVQSAQDADGSRLVIEGDTSGILIGRRGQTLDALEYLINRIVAREDEHSGRVVVDSQNYRIRRRQALEDLARRLADRARRRGKTVTLNPMSPRDRRVVHLALQGEPSLITRSAGKGYFRRLLIIPEGDRGDPEGRRRPRRSTRES